MTIVLYRVKVLSNKPQALLIAKGLPPSPSPSHAEVALASGYSPGTESRWRLVWALPLEGYLIGVTISLLQALGGWIK